MSHRVNLQSEPSPFSTKKNGEGQPLNWKFVNEIQTFQLKNKQRFPVSKW